jgi:hypothetical protein
MHILAAQQPLPPPAATEGDVSEPASPVETPQQPDAPGAVRLTVVALAITSMYLLLQYVWLGLTPFMAAPLDARLEAGWAREAADVRGAAAAADAVAPPEWRAAAWRLGLQIGYAGHIVGSFAAAPPEDQARARQRVAARLQNAEQLGQALGIGPVGILTVQTANDFVRENDRLEADELGIASRIEARASARHRHLLLLGMHVGIALATADATRGALLDPNRAFIGKHATLAGVPPGAWEPVARRPDAATDADRVKQYAGAVSGLDEAVARLESWH